MILATADSNIYVSALQFGGVALEFLNAARGATFQLVTSETILAEVRGVLLRKFRWSKEMLDEAISEMRDFIRLVTPIQTLNVIAEDPEDDRVIECAIASGSGFIVTGDRHLLRLIQYQNIRVIKLSEFMELIPRCSA